MTRLSRRTAVFALASIALILVMSCGKPAASPTPAATASETDSRPVGVLASSLPRSMMPSTQHGVENMYLHVSFIDEQHGWVAADRSVLGTTDGGEHWRILHTFDQTAGISYIRFFTPLRGLVLLEPGLVMTTDGGVTWNSVNEETEALNASFADENYGWMEADLG